MIESYTDANSEGPQPGEPSAFCPRALAQGLLLEDRRIFLPWGARRIQLTGACCPDRLEPHISWDELNWEEPVLLHGLKVARVQVVLYPYGWLDDIWIWLAQDSCCQTATHAFQRAHDHLTGLLGQPFIPPAEQQCETYLALAAWEWPDTRLGLFLRADEVLDSDSYCAVAHIARRPMEK